MFAWNIKVLHYERINISEGIDINKSNKWNKCVIYHYWYFKDKGFKYEPYVCSKCYDISMMPYKLEIIAIRKVEVVDYR